MIDRKNNSCLNWKIWYKWDWGYLATFLSPIQNHLCRNNQFVWWLLKSTHLEKNTFWISKSFCCFQLYIDCLTMKHYLTILLFGTISATDILPQDSYDLSRKQTENGKYDCLQGIWDYKQKQRINISNKWFSFFLTERSCTEVTCSFTIDNEVKSVEYVDQMGKSFYLTPSGDKRNWQKEKMINFRSCNPFKPGQLKIKGKDFDGKRDTNFYCTWSGLLLHCKLVVFDNL